MPIIEDEAGMPIEDEAGTIIQDEAGGAKIFLICHGMDGNTLGGNCGRMG